MGWQPLGEFTLLFFDHCHDIELDLLKGNFANIYLD